MIGRGRQPLDREMIGRGCEDPARDRGMIGCSKYCYKQKNPVIEKITGFFCLELLTGFEPATC
jgi:hypothetical protein